MEVPFGCDDRLAPKQHVVTAKLDLQLAGPPGLGALSDSDMLAVHRPVVAQIVSQRSGGASGCWFLWNAGCGIDESRGCVRPAFGCEREDVTALSAGGDENAAQPLPIGSKRAEGLWRDRYQQMGRASRDDLRRQFARME